jgi:hypothetical protein
MAVLQFESLGVTTRNIVRINGADVFGGITPGPAPRDCWRSHCLVVGPNVLNDQNVLHIESVFVQLAHEQTLDNFLFGMARPACSCSTCWAGIPIGCATTTAPGSSEATTRGTRS